MVVAGAASVSRVSAEDTKSKWQFGFGVSYYSTVDYIRSNSDIAIAKTVAGQNNGLPAVLFVDPRPDQNMLNQPSVRDNFKYDFNGSYGLTRWLAVELATSYLRTNVGNIEFYHDDKQSFPGPGVPVALGTPEGTTCGPDQASQCYRYGSGDPSSTKLNLFIPVGEITEVPVQLSGLVRFRPESQLDPYIGLGVGYIYANLKTSDQFESRNNELQSLNVSLEYRGEITDTTIPEPNPGVRRAADPGFHPGPLKATVNSGFEYHAVGGIDYYVNDHVSVYVDARYVWADSRVNITMDGAHQVMISSFFDGKLQTQSLGSLAAPDLWEDTGLAIPGCTIVNGHNTCQTSNGPVVVGGDGFFATEDSNGNGTLDRSGCGSGGLCEGDGHLYIYRAGYKTQPTVPGGAGTPYTSADAVTTIDCSGEPVCPWRDASRAVVPGSDPQNPTFFPISEDLNGNDIMDRFLSYGVDVCTVTGNTTNPICGPQDIQAVPHYLWPVGCTTSRPQLPNVVPEGCPIPRASPEVQATSSDDTRDLYLVQGGFIKLGGFGLGVGVKFTF